MAGGKCRGVGKEEKIKTICKKEKHGERYAMDHLIKNSLRRGWHNSRARGGKSGTQSKQEEKVGGTPRGRVISPSLLKRKVCQADERSDLSRQEPTFWGGGGASNPLVKVKKLRDAEKGERTKGKLLETECISGENQRNVHDEGQKR